MTVPTPSGSARAASRVRRPAGRGPAAGPTLLSSPTRSLAWSVLAAALLLLAGCGANMRAAIVTARQAMDGGATQAGSPAGLDPRFDYLRVHVGRQAGWMVRADDGPSPRGPLTHWYSADGALLRLLDGRLAGMTDGSRSWRATGLPVAVDWTALSRGGALEYRQTVDLQPGYRLGLVRQRRLQASAEAAPGHRLQAPPQVVVQWFVEKDAGGADNGAMWYAIDMAAQPPRVLYGQACLEPDWCLSWQTWRAGESGR
jgi:hypothetical protein